ncbi:hypothetical protein ACF1FE_30125 [Streptomyces griseofuscus]|uniref:hypothetical protein n=1 Tax=Streptomyces griseofuscus TaxID=146922 RepID=UPI003700B529
MRNGKKPDAHERYMGSQEFIAYVYDGKGNGFPDREMVILFIDVPQLIESRP